MGMLADQVDAVIGVDTHKHTHTAAVVTPTGGLLDHLTLPTDAFGARRVLAFARQHAPGRRVSAIEGTGSYGSGLTTFLLERGERVVEIDRPKRPARRNGAKSDELDALRAAREALGREHLAQPRRRGDREAMRVLLCTREGAVLGRTRAIAHLHGLVVNAPAGIRDHLRKLGADELLERCARLRTGPAQSTEHRATVTALRSTARRALALEGEAADLESRLELIVARVAPALLHQPGIGVVSAARVLNAWSHRRRIRIEAAFAMLAGVSPIPASSGQTVRHRLNRSGDRQLNRAPHTIVLSRLQHHAETRDYAARRRAEGRTDLIIALAIQAAQRPPGRLRHGAPVGQPPRRGQAGRPGRRLHALSHRAALRCGAVPAGAARRAEGRSLPAQPGARAGHPQARRQSPLSGDTDAQGPGRPDGLKLVLEPIFEADFYPSSYGYRVGRRAQDAIAEIVHFTRDPSGYEWVAEADIEACFDRIDRIDCIDHIDQGQLMAEVGRRVGDRRVLRLVRAFLKAGVMRESGRLERTLTGTPQGGIMSPLLANIALTALDRRYAADWADMSRYQGRREYLHRTGRPTYRLVRFADDLAVLVKESGARSMYPWRAGCAGTRMSGSEGGGGETDGREAARRPAADPKHPT